MLRSGKEIRKPSSSRETQNIAKTSNKQQAAEKNAKENAKAEHPAERNAVEAGREGEATNSRVTTHEQQQISEKSHGLPKMEDKMEIFFKSFIEKMNQNDASKGNVTIDAFAKVVPNFDGVSIPIRQWISNFDENAEAYELTAKQKYVNARNKMKGTAALLLETITVSNYNSLCEALIEEFDKPLNSAEVHKLLIQRRKQATENFHEYVLQMRKIAALSKVDEQSIITYIADGVELRNEQKYPLYSARSYKELIKAYELVEPLAKHSEANKRRQIASTRKEVDKSSNDGERKNQHCFNCGSTQHKRAECKEDTKCFKCNGAGHMAKQCTTTKQNDVNVVFDEKRMKQLKINNNNVSCLVDTGADVSLMRKSVYDQIGSNCELRKSFARLYGLGNVAADVLGEFTTQVVVDELSTQHTFLVVKDSKINVDAIVGYDFLKKFLMTNAGETSYNVLNVHSSNEVDVDPKYKEAVKQLIDNYKPSFIQSNSHIKLNIVPKSNNIIFRESPSRLSVMEREFVRKQVAEWLQKGIIRESCSEVDSKVVLAKKKDGSYRLCVDFLKKISKNTDIPAVTETEVNIALGRSGNAKVPELDGIPNGALTLALKEDANPFTETHQKCFRDDVFAKIWKQQQLVLLPKPNKTPGQPSSYRPFCMSDTMGKILERLIADRLEQHLSEKEGLCPTTYMVSAGGGAPLLMQVKSFYQ
ncbi:uncharacterized protein LOC128861858 [Anastrepha ludens]|uniref:uncharacterized protein LOC128861858 n=1 Tax=Anastrepha ludens TaxID=28586 RepID=UPI0023AEA05C|nr:uncharacterized protein LOC128861858 [Anastrepha ludens]